MVCYFNILKRLKNFYIQEGLIEASIMIIFYDKLLKDFQLTNQFVELLSRQELKIVFLVFDWQKSKQNIEILMIVQ